MNDGQEFLSKRYYDDGIMWAKINRAKGMFWTSLDGQIPL